MNPKLKSNLIHASLFIVTFITTTLAGAEWTYGRSLLSPGYSWADFASGLPYSISFLMILTAHEFGHYFTAVYYRVKTSLPYYIPIPPLLLPFNFGTLGALIRLRERVPTTQQNFDIGIAGPLAGFVVSLIFLTYGFTHLPPPEYIFQFHPEYEKYGLDYAAYVYRPEFMQEGTADVFIGKNLLFLFFEKFVGDPARIPNPHEIIHYPFLFAGFLSLVFTSINLLPIGQLDGGHVLYGMVGQKKHQWIASAFFVAFIFYAGLGYVSPREATDVLMIKIPLFLLFLFFALKGLQLSTKDTIMVALGIFAVQYVIATLLPSVTGYSGWLLFAFIIGRFIGIPHPPSLIEEPISEGRMWLGWIAVVVFIISFAPNPIDIILVTAPAP